MERSDIETDIQAQLDTVFDAFNVTFGTTAPGGSHERINFGSFTSTPGLLGQATGVVPDFMNLFPSAGTEFSASKVHSNNFAFFIESGDVRGDIINELTKALSGVAAHELGHSVGAQHHHSYGDPAIGPANYANTGGVQNTHIMATGPTDISEEGRETLRTLSQWENLTLEAAGGALPGYHFTTDVALATTVLAETDSFAGSDVGDTPASAKLLTLSFMPISGLNAANTLGRLFDEDAPGQSDADVDVYKFAVTGPSRILADVWSHLAYANSFDSQIRLIDTDGVTILATVDDTTFSGNAFDDGTFQGSKDSSLLNIVLPAAGTYFLEVSSLGNLGDAAGGNYNLIFGVAAIPEARAWLMLAVVTMGAFGFVTIRRKVLAPVSAKITGVDHVKPDADTGAVRISPNPAGSPAHSFPGPY